MPDLKHIRNFSIIAHIDHGKTTLSDRLLEATGTVEKREMTHDQLLDAMDLEQERGITIKSHPVCMKWTFEGEEYGLNLIDTPGHVDFSYEVSRSLAACEGALLLIDASQGVQAQTVANVTLAMKHNLTIIPVINKIDLPAANVQGCYEQMEEILALPREDAVLCSARNGIGIEDILKAVVQRIPPPSEAPRKGTRALIFDSVYDAYRGVVTYVRVFGGSVKRGDKLRLLSNGVESEIKEVGFFRPQMVAGEVLENGEVGYIIPNIKTPSETRMGDTITTLSDPDTEPLPGFQQSKPMVFSGIYPIDTADYDQLRASMAKLQLNDPAFVYQAETSVALGFGFRCGFLGLLHMEIVQERLRREYNCDIIATYPSVIYHVFLTNGTMIDVDNPVNLPDPSQIDRIEEPTIHAHIMIPTDYIGEIMNLVMQKRGVCINTENVDAGHVIITAAMPMHEILIDFHDKLKSLTRGYGSMDYEMSDYQEAKLVKLDMLVNGDPVDAFSSIVHADHAYERGRQIAERLAEAIPQHQFQVAVQAAVGGRVIARETVKAYRKNVLAKCYGGDITRKRKLLEKQKEGKKRMKLIGRVNIPQEAFVAVLKNNPDEG